MGSGSRTGRGNAGPVEKPEPVTPGAATIGGSIVVRGDVAGTGDVCVSGTVEGTIDLAGNRVTVEGAGRVEGRIVGRQVHVKGNMIGDIEALEKLRIGSTGRLEGTVHAPRVEVEDGAKLKCRIDMDRDEGPDAPAAAGRSEN